MEFPGKNIGMGCHLLLQGIFPTQGSNSHLLLWQMDSLPLSHQESLIYVCWHVIYFNHNSPMKYNTDEETEAQGSWKTCLTGRMGWLVWQTTPETQYFNTIKYHLHHNLMGYLVMILQVELQGPNFLLFNSSIILWTQRTAENHLHLVYREERESLKSLPESPRSGRLEVARPLLTTFHSPELSHTCPHLTARESGKCSLCVCLRGQGSRFGDHGALSLPLASRSTKEKKRDQFSTAPNPVFFPLH